MGTWLCPCDVFSLQNASHYRCVVYKLIEQVVCGYCHLCPHNDDGMGMSMNGCSGRDQVVGKFSVVRRVKSELWGHSYTVCLHNVFSPPPSQLCLSQDWCCHHIYRTRMCVQAGTALWKNFSVRKVRAEFYVSHSVFSPTTSLTH